MSDPRLPLRPPAWSLPWASAGTWYAPLCGVRPRGVLHATTNRALVTCPRCRALLLKEPV
jgi:hypothetical protein